jgi:hypothetical protein
LAWSAFGVAVATGASAVATGVLSRKSRGSTQAALIADLDRRRKLATITNALIGVSAATAVTWAALLIFARKGFYKGGRETPRPKVSLGVAPLPGGGYVSGGFQW